MYKSISSKTGAIIFAESAVNAPRVDFLQRVAFQESFVQDQSEPPDFFVHKFLVGIIIALLVPGHHEDFVRLAFDQAEEVDKYQRGLYRHIGIFERYMMKSLYCRMSE